MTSQFQDFLEQQLNHVSLTKRTFALEQLIEHARHITPRTHLKHSTVNMHCHSFYSYNAYGYSPTGLVWLAKQLGLEVAGIVDFDTLDGVQEFLHACALMSVRGSAAIETRIYISEFAEYVTNSPAEPGVSYACGIGFSSGGVNVKGQAILNKMRARAEARNRQMVDKLNDFLRPVAIDYDLDVLPLTPSGNATERHILIAYLKAVEKIIPKPGLFWSQKTGLDLETLHALQQDPALFSETIRRKLMKQGGIAYVQPGPDTFPPAEEFYDMLISNNALPTYNYLDGTSSGEQRMDELLMLLVQKGIAAFNLIPNLAVPDHLTDPDQRLRRAQLLQRNARLAIEFDLPLHIGTEMNSHGQRRFDNLDSPELSPLKQQFMDGAYFIYGHVCLQRTLGLGYYSPWAASYLPTRAQRNQFFMQAGYRIPPGKKRVLASLNTSMSPKEILIRLNAD